MLEIKRLVDRHRKVKKDELAKATTTVDEAIKEKRRSIVQVWGHAVTKGIVNRGQGNSGAPQHCSANEGHGHAILC